MPKCKKSTELHKAKKLSKTYIESGLNQSEVARQKGVTSQAINQQVNSKLVQDILQKFLDSPALDKTLISVAKEGLAASRSMSTVKISDSGELEKSIKSIPDHTARFRFWNGLMQAKGKIKQDGREVGIKILNVMLGYREPKKEIDATRSDDLNSSLRGTVGQAGL